jgi:alpha-L-fucosidase
MKSIFACSSVFFFTQPPFSTNPGSNVAKEVFSAFRQKGFLVGAYFSKPDWHSDNYWWNRFPPMDRNPNYDIKKHPEKWRQFVDYTHKQIDELMTDYGKIDVLWLDGGWVKKKTEEQAKIDFIKNYDENHFAINGQSQDIDMPLLVKNARAKQPGLIVVDREVPGAFQNYLTPEQHIPDEGLPYPWETCMTMGNSWSYVPGDIYKPTDVLIKKLVDIISKGGNYLLNVGPGPDGEWSDTVYSRLHEIGNWMKVNSPAVYETKALPVFGQGEAIRFVQSKDEKTKFIFLFNFPAGPLTINKLPIGKNAKLQMLGATSLLKWKQTAAGAEIIVPEKLKQLSDHVWVLKVQE